MDAAILLSSTPDHHSVSPYKQQKQKQSRYINGNHQGFIYGAKIHNLGPYNNRSISFGGRGGGDGVLVGPPPPFVSSSVPCKQPPLLPLPLSKLYSSLPSTGNNTRGGSPTTNKNSKSCPTTPFKRNSPKAAGRSRSQRTTSVALTPMDRLGPEPSDLPLSGAFNSSARLIFSLAPPPSSLPLPKFSLKPKLVNSCKVEAAAATGIDAGATDDLRKLLHLR